MFQRSVLVASLAFDVSLVLYSFMGLLIFQNGREDPQVSLELGENDLLVGITLIEGMAKSVGMGAGFCNI